MKTPAKPPLHRANMLFPRDLWRALTIAAAEDETTATAIVLGCVRGYLERREKTRARRGEAR